MNLVNTLEPCVNERYCGHQVSDDYFPVWLRRKENFEKWRAVLKQEPVSTELDQSSLWHERNWAKRPWEQWACRLGLTLCVDYMVPANRVSPQNIGLKNKLSVAEFKAKWPKSYKFFRDYIKIILARAKNHKL